MSVEVRLVGDDGTETVAVDAADADAVYPPVCDRTPYRG